VAENNLDFNIFEQGSLIRNGFSDLDIIMTKEITVSVMILTFNSERFIARCLNSMVSQTIDCFEVIIIDAGSKDKTIDIVSKYFNKLSINLISAPGSSIGEARNIGLKNAIGKYISFCDSDDFYFPDKLQKQVLALNESSDTNSATYSGFLHFDEGETDSYYSPRAIDNSVEKDPRLLLSHQIINLSSLMVTNVKPPVLFAEGNGGKFGEDFQYNISLLAAGYSFKFTPGYYSAVSIRADSYTNWSIQAKLTWHVIMHICRMRSCFGDIGVSPQEVDLKLGAHWAKFSIACVVSNDYDFDIKDSLVANYVPKHVVFTFRLKTLLRFSGLRHVLRFFWTVYRYQKTKPALERGLIK
jgi:glycosyltransferase involved in cell wall biosynthesis